MKILCHLCKRELGHTVGINMLSLPDKLISIVGKDFSIMLKCPDDEGVTPFIISDGIIQNKEVENGEKEIQDSPEEPNV